MGYFLYRIVRGARIFEQTSLLELRFSPYLRTDPALDVPQRIAAMAAVVEAIAAGAKVPEYAVDVRLVLCLHTLLSDEINAATVALALTRRDLVRGIDVAGPEQPLGARLDHFVSLYRQAAEHYLPATAHLGETAPEHVHPALFPYLRRIGHGVQIPLHLPHLLPEMRQRGICFELCPSTYLQTGTFTDLAPVREVTQRLDEAGHRLLPLHRQPGVQRQVSPGRTRGRARKRSHRFQRPGAVPAKRLQARVLTDPARNPCLWY